jgi:PAS domain S-box-containing protein
MVGAVMTLSTVEHFFASLPLQRLHRSLEVRLSIIFCLTILVALLSSIGVNHVAFLVHQHKQQPKTEKLAFDFNLFVLQPLMAAVASLATNQEVLDICHGKSHRDNPGLLQVLNTTQRILNVSLVYVMDVDGTVTGCSVAPEEMSLTGNNYRFRPYFYYAMAGLPYVYPAIGVTTKVKGVYFSAPIYGESTSKPIGVMVIKSKDTLIETFLHTEKTGAENLLLSPDGVVFAATNPDWVLRILHPVTPHKLEDLRASNQYGQQPFEQLPFSLDDSIITYNDTQVSASIHPVQINGWRIASISPLSYPWFAVILSTGFILAVGTLTGVVVYNSHKKLELADQVQAGQEASDRAQALHRTSVLELETIFSTSLVGIVLIRDGQIVNANKRMCEMFGYDQDELRCLDIRFLFTGRRAFRRFVRRYLHLLMNSNIEQVEYDLRTKNGALVPCTLSGKAIDRHHLGQGTVWVIEDISRRKAAEQQLEQSRQAAEAASVAKGQFLANMSHEIRTPMNGIIGLTNMLLRQELTDGQREHLELIQRSSIRLMTIINDILDFSKLEAGRFELEYHSFSLRGLLREVVQPMEPTIRRKHLHFKLQVDPAVPDIIHGDQTKIMQVLTNLLDNSLKFTKHGTVSLDVRMRTAPEHPQQMLVFEVADTGMGILPSYHHKVFESFSQADSSHSRKFGGTGLGLSISKGLVELMGGSIWFESAPEQGSSFWFTVPLVAAQNDASVSCGERTTGQHEDSIIPQGQGRRILVAEDEYINSLLIRNLLQQAGYHVTMVRNGREAVEAWRGGIFDCVLMDIQMPEMDGYEAVARIREAERGGAHIPIIAMTAHALSGDRQKCIASGMDDYIAKPIDGQRVLLLLHQYLPTAAPDET